MGRPAQEIALHDVPQAFPVKGMNNCPEFRLLTAHYQLLVVSVLDPLLAATLITLSLSEGKLLYGSSYP